MRLYLAVAALMLTLVACTEAQEDTVQQTFSNIGTQMTEFGKSVANTARETVDRIKNSDAAVTAKNWLEERLESMKRGFQDMMQ